MVFSAIRTLFKCFFNPKITIPTDFWLPILSNLCPPHPKKNNWARWFWYLKTGGAPVDELNGTLGLHGGDGGVDVLGHHVSSIQQTHGHVLAFTWIALKKKKTSVYQFESTQRSLRNIYDVESMDNLRMYRYRCFFVYKWRTDWN